MWGVDATGRPVSAHHQEGRCPAPGGSVPPAGESIPTVGRVGVRETKVPLILGTYVVCG